jgi:cell division protein FtsI (penicillin-binding protein 3)
MAIEDKQISYRIYLVAVFIFLMAIGIIAKLANIQFVHGKKYRQMAKDKTVKTFVIPANKGNIYSADGSLLATSVPNYDIYFDAKSPKEKDFNDNVKKLSDSLSKLLGKPSSYYHALLRRARANENQYQSIAKGLSYSEFIWLKKCPLFNLGTYKGGMIHKPHTVREHPMGDVARRIIGYERITPDGKLDGKGIEWSFRKYLNGKDGKVVRQKMAKGHWKPIPDANEIEPQDGLDVISTIDVYIQDIAHHALLKQMQKYTADHGCVVVMEVNTGHVKAISNLGRGNDGKYYETVNYAITESHEPGSTFKLVDLIALLEDKKADTNTVYNCRGGKIFYTAKNHKVEDAHFDGVNNKTLARGFEVSSNTVLVQAVYNSYSKNPSQFIDRINAMGLNKPLGLPFKGEGIPIIPQVGAANWYPTTLPWMAFGYGVMVTPLQTLSLYNAIANNGEMIKPIFVSEIKEFNKTIKKYNKQVINPKICSDETLKKVKAVLANVVKKGTGKSLYSKDFSMAGKTGTAKVDYNKGGAEQYYSSSFVGFFPVENPKYTCIVIVHKPNVKVGYYGADVAGPVFQAVAQKIFTDSPSTNEVKNLNKKIKNQEQSFEAYYAKLQTEPKVLPNLKGMSGMDAVALLENLKVKVIVKGIGKVKKQSIPAGKAIDKNTTVTLELS